MVFEREMIAREAAEGMHDDHIERAALAGGEIEQPLQFGAAVISAAGAGLNKFARDFPTLSRAVGERLPPLVGDGKIVLRLPAGR